MRFIVRIGVISLFLLVVFIPSGFGQQTSAAEDLWQWNQQSSPGQVQLAPVYQNITPENAANLVEVLQVRIESERIYDIAWSVDSDSLMISTDTGLWIVNVADPASTPMLALEGDIFEVTSDRQAAMRRNKAENKVEIMDANSGELLFTLDTDYSQGFVWDMDTESHTLASVVGFSVQLWDYADQTEVASRDFEYAGFILEISPDGEAIVTAPGCLGAEHCPISYWNISPWEEVWIDSELSAIFQVAFSAQGDLVAAVGMKLSGFLGSPYGRVWNTATGEVLTEIEGEQHTGLDIEYFLGAAFSPDNSLLAVGTKIGHTVEIWDVQQATHLASLEGHTESVRRVAFNSDGTMVAGLDYTGTVIVWGLEP